MDVSGFRFMFAATLAGLSAVRAAADEPSVSLLQLPSARLEAELVLSGQDGLVPALIDGDPTTVATFPVDAAVPVDLVFGFGELTVAPVSASSW